MARLIAFVVLVMIILGGEGKNGTLRKRKCIRRPETAHFVPFYPKVGNLFVPSYKGYLEDDVYIYWKSTPWSDKLTKTPADGGYMGGFQMRKTGIYSLYFQVTFWTKGEAGITLEMHSKTLDIPIRLMSCVIASDSNSIKAVSCYTSGTHYLMKKAVLFTKPLYPGRNFSMLASNTFWGMIKLR